ncbi:response regulator [Enterococcus termitis]|nr:response regulator [Enterococcus termitis]
MALIDDHQLVLEGLRNKLATIPEFDIVGAYTTVEEFLICIKYKEIDIIVMDLMLDGIHGFDLVKKIQAIANSKARIILISGFYEEMLHKRALELGIKAFLRKETSYEELISTIINVHQGNMVVPDFLISVEDNPILSEIELKVINLVANEYTNEKIAKELYISRRTVETHVTNICRKLSVNSRIGAVREALRLNLVQ